MKRKAKLIKEKQVSVWRLMAPAFLLLPMIPLLAAFAIYEALVSDMVNANQRNILQSTADALSAHYRQALDGLSAKAQHLAADSEVIQVLQQDTSSQALEALIKRLHPDIAGVRVARRGTLRLDEESSPPISYTGIDVIRRAKLGKQVLPELDGDYLYTAAAVMGPKQNSVLGVVLLIYNIKVIHPKLSPDALAQVEVSLSQTFQENHNQVAWVRTGSAWRGGHTQDVTAKVGDHWLVKVTVSADQASGKVFITMMGFGGLVSVCALLFVGLSYWRLKSAFIADLRVLNTGIRQLLNGKTPQHLSFRTKLVARMYKGIYDAALASRGSSRLGAGLKSLEMMQPMFDAEADDDAEVSDKPARPNQSNDQDA